MTTAAVHSKHIYIQYVYIARGFDVSTREDIYLTPRHTQQGTQRYSTCVVHRLGGCNLLLCGPGGVLYVVITIVLLVLCILYESGVPNNPINSVSADIQGERGVAPPCHMACSLVGKRALNLRPKRSQMPPEYTLELRGERCLKTFWRGGSGVCRSRSYSSVFFSVFPSVKTVVAKMSVGS